MTIHEAPNLRKLLRLQKKLPVGLRGCAVVCAFKEEQPRSFCDEFLRIHLTPGMLDAGEKSFYRAEVFQPQRTGRQLCSFCRIEMKQYSEVLYKCQNPGCMKADAHFSGPIRGVIDIRTSFEAYHRGIKRDVDFFAGYYQHKISGKVVQSELVHGCLLILDRRYDELTLAQVLRTATLICDEFGVKILN